MYHFEAGRAGTGREEIMSDDRQIPETIQPDVIYTFSQFVKRFGDLYGITSRQTLYNYRNSGRLKVCKHEPSKASGREYLYAIENRYGIKGKRS